MVPQVWKGCTITFILRVMTLLGLWDPEDWDRPWKGIAYRLYAKLLDAVQLTYVILKCMHTYYSKDHNNILLESLFESLYILIIGLQRFFIRWSSPKLRNIVCEIKKYSCDRKYFIFYETQGKGIIIVFAAGAFSAVIQVFVNIMIGAEKGNENWGKKNPERRMFVNIWLPFDETVSPYYEITKPLNMFCMVLTCTSLYIFSALIPIFILRVCCHFRILAKMFKKNCIVGKEDVLLKLINEELIEKRDLISLIHYHQHILNLMTLMNKLFHWIVFLKIVFLSLPILLGALTLSQSSVGSFHFIRYILLMTLPLLELFLFCWCGEQLCSHSLLIHRAVYFCPWNLLDVRQQKNLVIVSIRALRPVRLDILPHFIPVSIETFIRVTRMSYSAYMLLLSFTSSNKQRASN